MEYRALGSTGIRLSVIGLGGSGYGKVYGQFDESKAVRALRKGLDRGINYIDTAYWYGQGESETFIGRSLKGIPRHRFSLATKVGRYEKDATRMFDFSAEKVTKSAYESLKRLQLDYVDLLQVHDVEFAPTIKQITEETLPALQRLKDKGLCKFIGITGYPLDILRKVIEQSTTQIDAVLSYARLTLNDSSLMDHISYFSSKNVGIINASPVGMGLLTSRGVQTWHPATHDIKTACKNATDYCKKQDVDISHLAINYSCSFKEVCTTLVSMNDEETLEKNLQAALNPLEAREVKVRDYIMQHYFMPLKVKHWEGVEITAYKKKKQEK